MKTPKVFFPIIAYGGVVHADFMMSMSSLFLAMAQKKILASSIVLGFESLISRGRNASAAYTLGGDYTHLMFVDTDVSFDPKDFFRLLDLNKDVAVGLYPKKYISDSKLKTLFKKYSELPPIWRNLATDFSSELDLSKMKNESIEVEYAATGFMLIKRECFEKIIKERPDIKYQNDIDGYMSAGDNFYDFFQCRINPKTKKYESEDYGFCQLWRSLGGKIHAIPDITLNHRGYINFSGNLKQQYESFYV